MFNVAPVNANRKAKHLVKAPASRGSRPKTPLTWRLQWSFLWSPANRDRQVFAGSAAQRHLNAAPKLKKHHR
jgi:hypothetical protein